MGLEKFGCSRAEVVVDVLQAPSRGVFGLFGVRPARARIRLVDASCIARRVTEHLLLLAGLQASVHVEGVGEGIELLISGEDTRLVIGRHGQTLDALQSLVSTLTDRVVPERTRITLDAEGYRKRRAVSIARLVRRLVGQVRRSGRPATLRPMPAGEREIVHRLVREEPGIEVRSIGPGPERKMILARRKD